MCLACECPVFITRELETTPCFQSVVDCVDILCDDEYENIIIIDGGHSVLDAAGDFYPVLAIRMMDRFGALAFR